MNNLVRDRIISVPASGGLQPYTGSELFGWWDPSDSLNVTKSSGRFDQVNDKSAEGNNISSLGNLRPFDSRFHNGIEVLDFQGGQRMDSIFFTSQSQPNIIILAGKSDLNDNYRYFVDGVDTSSRVAVFAHYLGSGLGYYAGGSSQRSTPAYLTPLIATVVFNGVNSKMYINGNLHINNSSSGTNSITSIRLGDRAESPTTYALDGWIGDVFVYNSNITNAQLNQTGQYLSNKYAISYTDIT